MNPETWAGFGTALAAFGVAVLGWLRSHSANKRTKMLRTTKVDIEAQDRAFLRLQNIYEAGLKQMDDQIIRMRSELQEERTLTSRLRRRVDQLEAVVDKLRSMLRRHGIQEQEEDIK
jgi:hypothetical protein